MNEEYSNITVIKRDDTKEPFNVDKLMRIAVATGLSEEQAQRIIDKITDWVKDKKEVRSTEIRELFSKELKNVNEYASDLYDWYQNVKEKSINNEYEVKPS